MALRRRADPERPQPRSLIETIQQVADCPCDQHQRAFLDALAATDELIFLVATANIAITDGDQRQVGAGEQIRLQQVNAQGHTFLLAFPDLDAAHRHDPNATYAGIGQVEAIRMTLGNPDLDGILIAAATDNDAWAAAPRDSLSRLLAPKR
jgi:hypothetical protein